MKGKSWYFQYKHFTYIVIYVNEMWNTIASEQLERTIVERGMERYVVCGKCKEAATYNQQGTLKKNRSKGIVWQEKNGELVIGKRVSS